MNLMKVKVSGSLVSTHSKHNEIVFTLREEAFGLLFFLNDTCLFASFHL
jgi:hypothetical protein